MSSTLTINNNLTKKINYLLKNKEKHTFHLVDNSQLPVITSFAAMLLVMSFVFYLHPSDFLSLHGMDNSVFNFSWFFFSTVLFGWFIIVVIESGQGYHTWAVRTGLRFGMLLFIISEIMFFFAFFWAFFHVSLSPAIAVGGIWPPKTIQALDVWGLPLVNTLLLLSSGVTITLAHHGLLKAINEDWLRFFGKHLAATVLLGTIFLFCQGIEYEYGIIFRWKESIYGSTFFVTTGFHGLHVTIGTIFLLFCLIRLCIAPLHFDFIDFDLFFSKVRKFFVQTLGLEKFIQRIASSKVGVYLQNYFINFSFKKNQHLGFEAAAWYWHFVDVVWIFLFITVYWWGN
jgi:heme/copper-type cytochrome/quinol oxidase subunit 3